MSEKKEKIPKLRFRGFTDAWEQRKLGELGNIMTGSTPSTSHSEYYSEDGIPWVTPTDISSNLISNTLRKLSQEGEKIGRVVPPNTILVTCIASIGKNALLQVKGSFNQQINSLTPNAENDPYFLLSESELWSAQMKRRAATATMQIVNKTEFSELKTLVPVIAEQQQIGDFFRNLDHLISLQQRKCDTLAKMKKSLLQKMFPQKGEDKPELRFRGFTDAWERRKFKDVTQRVQGNDGRMDLPTLTISAGNGWMNQVDRFSGNIAGKEQKNYTLLKKGQLSYNHGNSKLAKYGAVFELRHYEEALVPRVYHSFKMTYGNGGFIDYMFSSKLPDRELGKLVSSGARMDGLLNINYLDFSSISIIIPSADEQDKINDFLRLFDDIVTLHQHKLDSLKTMKKALLQQMFI